MSNAKRMTRVEVCRIIWKRKEWSTSARLVFLLAVFLFWDDPNFESFSIKRKNSKPELRVIKGGRL